MSGLDPATVARRLRAGARLFRFLDASEAQRAMAGELASDGVRSKPQLDFARRVEQRLEVLRQLNRRRDAVRLGVSSSL